MATNGLEAVQRCAELTPDLILMDLIMPVMDGVEATRQIMAETPCAIVIGTVDRQQNGSRVFEAMGHGALDVVDTPALGVGDAKEAAAPLLRKILNIGWLIGQAATRWVADWDHWIAFTLLVVLGLHMIYDGLKHEDEAEEKSAQHSFLVLAVTAFATSIDALAVGVGLAFVDVNIWVAAAAIGLATMTMVTIGVMLGRVLGTMFGKRAEIVGGVVLMIVGATILYEHLSV